MLVKFSREFLCGAFERRTGRLDAGYRAGDPAVTTIPEGRSHLRGRVSIFPSSQIGRQRAAGVVYPPPVPPLLRSVGRPGGHKPVVVVCALCNLS